MCQTRGQTKQNVRQQGTSGIRKSENNISHQTANLVEHNSGSQTGDTEELRLFTIRTVQSNHNEEIIINLLINGTPIYMEVDTGASIGLVSDKDNYNRYFCKKLQNVHLRAS